MFQFPGFASCTYVFSAGYGRSRGFPHSEMHGSKLIRSSPCLIAAYHVLHRLSAPRHSLDALKSLDHSHYQCSPVDPARLELGGPAGKALRKTSIVQDLFDGVRSSPPALQQTVQALMYTLLGRTAQTNPFFTMSKEQSQTLYQCWKLEFL